MRHGVDDDVTFAFGNESNVNKLQEKQLPTTDCTPFYTSLSRHNKNEITSDICVLDLLAPAMFSWHSCASNRRHRHCNDYISYNHHVMTYARYDLC